MINILELWKNPHQKFVLTDVETEGLNLFKHRPWQLSYLVCNGGKVTNVVDDYIWIPDLKITAGAAQVTRFNYEEYKVKARPKEEVMDRWKNNTKGAIFVAHNGLNYDIYPLKLFYEMCNIGFDWSFFEKFIDTNALAKAYLTGRKNNQFKTWDEFICWQLSCLTIRDRKLKTSQKSLLKSFNIQFDENRLHDAIYDVTMLKQIFEKIVYGLKI